MALASPRMQSELETRLIIALIGHRAHVEGHGSAV